MKQNKSILVIIFFVIVFFVGILFVFTITNDPRLNGNPSRLTINTDEYEEIDFASASYEELNFTEELDMIVNHLKEKSLSKFSTAEMNSALVYLFSFEGIVTKEELNKAAYTYFGVEKFALKEGNYKLVDKTTSVTVTLQNDVYVIISNNLKTEYTPIEKWNKQESVYKKGDSYIILYNYITTPKVTSLTTTYYGKTALYVTQTEGGYKIEKIVYEKFNKPYSEKLEADMKTNSEITEDETIEVEQ